MLGPQQACLGCDGGRADGSALAGEGQTADFVLWRCGKCTRQRRAHMSSKSAGDQLDCVNRCVHMHDK